jgi:hypothetical protein
MRWVAIILCLVLIGSCFITWATIEEKNIIISGVQAKGTAFGKPGYMHILLSSIIIILLLIKRVLTIRISLFITAFNAAWAIRNFVLIPTCYAGICPEKQFGIYLMLTASLALLITNLLTTAGKKQV